MNKARRNKNIDRERRRNLVMMFLPSIIGMSLCVMCLAGTTFAWFTSNATVSVAPIKATNDIEKYKSSTETPAPVDVTEDETKDKTEGGDADKKVEGSESSPETTTQPTTVPEGETDSQTN